MTFEQADILHYAIQKMDGVSSVKVYERTGDAVIILFPLQQRKN